MKVICVALIALFSVGCNMPCRDGYNQHQGVSALIVGSTTSYSACRMGCTEAEEPSRCGCSSTCPCWRRHN